jgi:hypothetical protein
MKSSMDDSRSRMMILDVTWVFLILPNVGEIYANLERVVGNRMKNISCYTEWLNVFLPLNYHTL